MSEKTLWRAARVETILSCVVAGRTLAAAVLFLGDEIGRHIDGFEAWIVGLGPLAPAAFVLLYVVLSSIFVPDILLGIIAGTSFGFTRGLATAMAGSLGGATLQRGPEDRDHSSPADDHTIRKPKLSGRARGAGSSIR
jgi:uncharacterized membrane protein YdjX (TVP38/TMEM64 family)